MDLDTTLQPKVLTPFKFYPLKMNERVTRSALFLFFAVVFAQQVFDSYVKYAAKDYIVSSLLEDRASSGMPFPSISVCPGIKEMPDVSGGVSMTPTIFKDREEGTRR